jgi:hypothetical protein
MRFIPSTRDPQNRAQGSGDNEAAHELVETGSPFTGTAGLA